MSKPTFPFKPGERVRWPARRAYWNLCTIAAGEAGVVLRPHHENDDGATTYRVRLDQYHNYLDEWGNEVFFVAAPDGWESEPIPEHIEKEEKQHVDARGYAGPDRLP